MSVDYVLQISNRALFTVIETAAPILLVSMVIGLIVSIFQTVTSIQKQTLTFVPKIIAVFLTLIIAGSWMLNNMSSLMEELWSDFSIYIR